MSILLVYVVLLKRKSINVNPSTETKVDVSDLSKGTYLVKIRTASEEVTKKIIVH